MDADTPARRPLKSRESTRIRAFAAALARRGVTPNAISVASIAFAAVSLGAFLAVGEGRSEGAAVVLLAVAAVGIQLRLACNLLDGLVAIEGARKGRAGDLFNEVPDRLADTLALVGAGYAISEVAWAPELGWAAALAAALTAYVRTLGGALGQPQRFLGPLAKQQRMALLTAACLLSAVEAAIDDLTGRVLLGALLVIAAGSLVTCAVRLRAIARELPA